MPFFNNSDTANVPENFFNVLSSGCANKELYIYLILNLHEYISSEGNTYSISRRDAIELFEQWQRAYAAKNTIEEEVEEDSGEKRIPKPSDCLNKFLRTGWLLRDTVDDTYEVTFTTPAAIQITALLSMNRSTNNIALGTYFSTITEMLQKIRTGAESYHPYSALQVVLQNARECTNALFKIRANEQRKFSNMLRTQGRDEALMEIYKELDDYQNGLIKQLERENFTVQTEGTIKDLISDIENSDRVCSRMIEEMKFSEPDLSDDEALERLYRDFDAITGMICNNFHRKYMEIIAVITQYIQTAQKHITMLMNDETTGDQIKTIIEFLNKKPENETEEELEAISDIQDEIVKALNIATVHVADEAMIKKPLNTKRDMAESPMVVPERVPISPLATFRKMQSLYTRKSLSVKVHKMMNGKKELTPSDIEIKNKTDFQDFVAIIAFYFDNKRESDYEVTLKHGRVTIGTCTFPDFTIKEKEKKEKTL